MFFGYLVMVRRKFGYLTVILSVKTVLFLLTSRLHNGEHHEGDYDCDRNANYDAHLIEMFIVASSRNTINV
jgi:hypothetical protein